MTGSRDAYNYPLFISRMANRSFAAGFSINVIKVKLKVMRA